MKLFPGRGKQEARTKKRASGFIPEVGAEGNEAGLPLRISWSLGLAFSRFTSGINPDKPGGPFGAKAIPNHTCICNYPSGM